jgi:hypothetical protein
MPRSRPSCREGGRVSLGLLDCTPALFRRKHSAADVDLITHTHGCANTHHPGSRETHKPDDIIIRCDEKRHRTKTQTHSFVRLGQRCGVLRKTPHFSHLFLCLSRACLGKKMHLIYKWRKKWRFSYIDHRLGRTDGGPERCTGATPIHRRPQHSPLAAIHVSFVSVFVFVFVCVCVCVCVCVVVVGVFLKQRGVSLRGLREHGTLF